MKPSQPGASPVLDEADLLHRARAARQRAYAPYSHFHVGAVVVAADGEVYEGANVENASYGLTMCAERVAIGSMAASGQRGPIIAVAIVGDGDDALTPCGACRQVIYEFGPEAVVYGSGDGGRPVRASIRDLLPHAFGPMRLGQARA